MAEPREAVGEAALKLLKEPQARNLHRSENEQREGGWNMVE